MRLQLVAKQSKKQIGFYADPDVEEFLETLEPGVKTRTINAALRAFRENRPTMGQGNIYPDKWDSLAAWLNGIRPPITVTNLAGETIALGALLERFLNQERQRPSSETWQDLAAKGITFEAAVQRCDSCKRSLLASDAISTRHRGILCRRCLEMPLGGASKGNDVDRYAFNAAHVWVKLHPFVKDVQRQFSDRQYEALPRYVQEQVDYDEFFHAVKLFVLQLKRQRK